MYFILSALHETLTAKKQIISAYSLSLQHHVFYLKVLKAQLEREDQGEKIRQEIHIERCREKDALNQFRALLAGRVNPNFSCSVNLV